MQAREMAIHLTIGGIKVFEHLPALCLVWAELDICDSGALEQFFGTNIAGMLAKPLRERAYGYNKW